MSGSTGRGTWWCTARRRAAGRPGTHRGTSAGVTDDGLAPTADRGPRLGAAGGPHPGERGPGAGRVQPPTAPPPFDAGTGPERAAPTTAPTLAATTIRSM